MLARAAPLAQRRLLPPSACRNVPLRSASLFSTAAAVAAANSSMAMTPKPRRGGACVSLAAAAAAVPGRGPSRCSSPYGRPHHHALTLAPPARLLHASARRLAGGGDVQVVQVPQMAESLSEGTLKQWNKKKGDFVQADEEVAVIETDKIDVTVNAPTSGTITETMANEEDTVTVGQDLFKLEPGDAPAEQSKEAAPEPKKEEQPEPKQQEAAEPKAEPKKDEAQQQQPPPPPKKEAQPSSSAPKPAPPTPQRKPTPSKSDEQHAAPPPPPAAPGSREERRVKMSRMRLRIAERLKQSQNTAASLTTFNEIDMTSLIQFRARHKERVLKETGVKLGFMGAFAKASALALREIPAANATIEGEGLGDTIVYRDYVDLSVAVSTDKGLVTPVVRNIESMSILDIEREISAMGKKARDGKLTLEDMAGGTFTISNGGVFGSLFGTPILNLPGAAILGLHAVKQQPYVVDGKVEVRPIMVVALTYDHRLLDGREAVTTLVRIKEYIEDMPRMLL